MGTIVALLLTIFVYLFFPIGYRCANGKVSKKKGNKFALWNSVICCSFFCLLAGLITGGETVVTSFAPAVTYYFISKWILIDKNIPDEEEKINELTTEEKKISSVKKYQIATIPIVCSLLLFAIIYPIVATNNYKNKIPDYKSAISTKLSNLNANQKVYCEQDGNYFYIYTINDDNIVIYKFQNSSRYKSSSSTLEYSGKATSTELKNYFDDNIFSGKPPISLVMPSAIPMGITFGCIFIIMLVIVLIVIHRKATDIYYKIAKKDKEMIDLKNKYQKDDISKQEYNSEKRKYLSEKIIKNNKFFDVFKLIY